MGTLRFSQADRDAVFFHVPDVPSTPALTHASTPLSAGDLAKMVRSTPTVLVARKAARILAIRIDHPFEVETDRGLMQAQAGDWLVTNHPDDDPESDIWSISHERFSNTYEVLLDPAEARIRAFADEAAAFTDAAHHWAETTNG